MDNQLTQILTMLLIGSIIILFVLVCVFIMLALKKKKENEPKEDEEVILQQTSQKVSNVIKAKEYTANDIKDFLDFEDIKDNMIIQDKGKRLVMVIHCQGVNYDLMSSMEKVSVEQGFVQFLNSLTRPIQLYVQSRKINLEQSIENYKKRLRDVENRYNKAKIQYEQAQKNEYMSKDQLDMIKLEYTKQKNLFEYTKDIISNTEKMSLNKNILTKNYYIAISYVPEDTNNMLGKEEILEMAFSDLYTTAQSLLRVLSVCGVTGKVLDSVGLAELVYVAYNRDASEVYGVDKAIRAGYDSYYSTASDVIEKRIQEIDKMIHDKALDLANETVENVQIKSRRRKELEEKEKNIQSLIKNMAKMMIEENIDHIGEEIANESIEEINKSDKKAEKKASKETKKTKEKKGA